jgi:hypothetical protein
MALYAFPIDDFVTSSLSGVMAAGATTATIGTGLGIPASNGLLELSYDTANAIGATDGPETIFYATYNSGTGALTGVVKGLAGTSDVQHSSGQSVQSAFSSAHFIQPFAAYTVTWGGFAANPTYTAWWWQMGKLVFYTLSITAAGTSNATTLTVSLPAAPARTVTITGGQYQDNGNASTTGPCTVSLTAGNSTANIGISTSNVNGWTAANGKYASFSIYYEAQ